MPGWEIEQIRVSLFLDRDLSADALKALWQKLEETPYEREEVRPIERVKVLTLAKGTSVITLVSQPLRVDNIVAMAAIDAEPLQFETLNEVISKWSSSFESIGHKCTRAALGVVARLPVRDRLAGYREVLDRVPSLRFEPSDDLSDLIFQINVRRWSTALPNIRINRLMKWGVVIASSFNLNSFGVPVTTSADSFCRLELDLNTIPDEMYSFDPENLSTILNELKTAALEIMEKGERA